MTTYVERWQNWYRGVDTPQAYGEDTSYRVAIKFFDDIFVEDWGSGKGYFKYLYGPENCIGVDGTETPFTDVVVDLREYRSSVPGIHMRHVIEHNLDWDEILRNAAASFEEKMVLTIFTPMARKTQQIAWNEIVDVPDMSFAHRDIVKFFPDCDIKWKDYKTNTQYGKERVYLMEKK